ncbi:PAAR domain-containing protein [Paraburkholderia bannensis]|uniref:PAAR domain-containing protein n=1 Tax=Paraburkholderia bannensis TaxID=765414 RepID=UPI000483C269|nr:PAAR domain-containing protein [Paraburkholderia bannensis]
MMRRTLCVGDRPETGGEIQPLETHSYTINGHQPAIVGDKVLCLACNSIGTIAKAGGPRRHVHCGKELALDGDVLLCKCERPPQMLSSMQSLSWFEDSGEGRGQRGEARDIEAVPSSRLFDEQAELTGAGAREGYPYFIETQDGQQFSGRLEGIGRLPRIYLANEDRYSVYWGDEALAREESL